MAGEDGNVSDSISELHHDQMVEFPLMAAPPPRSQMLQRIRIKNRRKRYLDIHPEYFSPSLELGAPLLYDRMIRRFQSPTEREAEGRSKGYSGILEADLWRSEAKMEALGNPNTSATFTYKRGPDGEILAEEEDDVPLDKEDGRRTWRKAMEVRFLKGEDGDFEYKSVDESEEYDDRGVEEREEEDRYFAEEEPQWVLDGNERSGGGKSKIKGETGIQDF
ncbi:MAG: hypothetical protein M1830_002703 [Pleopsidium flavum]|nr:MAG: hypothetical protein M1830_002703 [Pleopsidium flavum]